MAKISIDSETMEVVIEAEFKDFEALLNRALSFYELLKESAELSSSLDSVKDVLSGASQKVQITIKPIR